MSYVCTYEHSFELIDSVVIRLDVTRLALTASGYLARAIYMWVQHVTGRARCTERRVHSTMYWFVYLHNNIRYSCHVYCSNCIVVVEKQIALFNPTGVLLILLCF